MATIAPPPPGTPGTPGGITTAPQSAASPPPDLLDLDDRTTSKSVVASQWQLMYWRFTRHKLAVVSVFIVAFFYLVAIFCEFLSPMDPNKISNTYRYVPPQPISFVNSKGEFSLRPGIFGLKANRNPETLRITYEPDNTRWVPISFFVKGDPYKFWGLWATDVHFMGIRKEDATALPPAAAVTSNVGQVVPTPQPSTGTGTTGFGSIGGFGASGGAPTVAPQVATPATGGAGSTSGSTGIGSIGGFGSQPAPTAAATAVRTPVPVPTTGSIPVPSLGGTGTTGATGTTATTAPAQAGLSAPATDFPFYILGTDRLGRDMLSRLLYGARISLSLGFIGVVLSLILGVTLGGISGYYGGTVDNVIQRVIEFIRSLPDIPLWLALSAALPPKWPPEAVYFAISAILSLLNWTTLARVVRGRFLALREEDFIMAARFTNCSTPRIIFRHMVPAFASHLIASMTLAVPGMILAETGLSFLGLGLRPPVISWGVLLQEAQNVQTVALFPWLLAAAVPIVIIVLAFNFMGDGLRDAADPYAR